MIVQLIEIDKITVSGRKRRLNQEKVNELSSSIMENGLLNPITVKPALNGCYGLIAGYHRLMAYCDLGLSKIPANVVELDDLSSELAEIDENLKRNELTVLEQGEHLVRREQILQVKGLRAKVGDNQHTITSKSASAPGAPPQKTTPELASEIGLSQRATQERKQIANDIIPQVKEAIADSQIADSTKQLLALARLEPQQQVRVAEKISSGEAKSVVDANRLIVKENVKEQEFPQGKYRVILADPPWSYDNSGAINDYDSYSRVQRHYPSMSLEDICTLPVSSVADKNAVLFLWVTSPLLPEGLQVIQAWGFTYKASFVWDKQKHNFGHYNSVRHEFLLVSTKGSCLPDSEKLEPSIVSVARSEHSAKPAVFRQLIERLYPIGNKLELFARSNNGGWTAYGNQLTDQ